MWVVVPIALNKQKLSTNDDSDIRLFLTLIELWVDGMVDMYVCVLASRVSASTM
jgi:hypothetical protein